MTLEFPTVVIPPNNIGEIKAILKRLDEEDGRATPEFDASDQTRQSARRAEGVGCRGDGEIDRAANADPGGERTDGEVGEVREKPNGGAEA